MESGDDLLEIEMNDFALACATGAPPLAGAELATRVHRVLAAMGARG